MTANNSGTGAMTTTNPPMEEEEENVGSTLPSDNAVSSNTGQGQESRDRDAVSEDSQALESVNSKESNHPTSPSTNTVSETDGDKQSQTAFSVEDDTVTTMNSTTTPSDSSSSKNTARRQESNSVTPEQTSLRRGPTLPGAVAVGDSESELRPPLFINNHEEAANYGETHQMHGEDEENLVEANLVMEEETSIDTDVHVDLENGIGGDAPVVSPTPPELVDATALKAMSAKKRRVLKISLLLLVVVTAVIVGYRVGVVFQEEGSSTGNTSAGTILGPPTIAPTSSPTLVSGPTEALDRIKNLLPLFTLKAIELDPVGPQARALSWLSLNANVSNFPDEKLVQRFALAALFYATDGPTSWETTTGWLSDADECTWWYLSSTNPGSPPPCHEDTGGLRHVDLGFNNLAGFLPHEIGLLTSMEMLMMTFTRMKGPIPTTIGLLTQLTSLTFVGSEFTGTFPTEVGLLSNLERLDLDRHKSMTRKFL